MNLKFNKFSSLYEAAFSHYSNGGFREGTPVTIKLSFLKHGYFKKHYSGDKNFVKFLSELIKNEVMFFIKRVVASGPTQNVKDANDNEGAGNVYLVLRTDPRTVKWPTEYSEFTIPGDYDLLEVKDYGINLPPVDAVPNKYERFFGTGSEPFEMKVSNGSRPKDDSLPIKNVSLPFTKKVKEKKYGV